MATDESQRISSTTLKMAVITYGTLFIILLMFYLFVRNRYKKVYNVRDSVPSLNCELARQKFSWLEWIPGIFNVKDDDLFEQAGLDAVMFLRLLVIGTKIAVVGCLNAIYLIPTYCTSEKTTHNSDMSDPLDSITLGYTDEDDDRLYASVLATYIIYGYAMYLIYTEFNWYIAKRHQYMSRSSAQNYTVFVGDIPDDMQSRTHLMQFFFDLYADTVVNVRMALDIKTLENFVNQREKLVPKLEHACNVLASTGERPMHKTKPCTGPKVDSIDTYKLELDDLNTKISRTITQLETEQEKYEDQMREEAARTEAGCVPEQEHIRRNTRPAAFVSFKTLQSAMSALQMIHYSVPFKLWTCEAPLPKDVFWANVGLPHGQVQVSKLIAGLLTAALCIFWTIPVTFVASLTKVEALKENFTFLRDATETFPWLDNFLAIVSPVALVILVAMLPIILLEFAKLEGHISVATLQASLFSKLSLFMIVQIFFVSAIAGALFEKAADFTKNPTGVLVDVLAKHLPEQAVTFMSYILVKTFVGVVIELLRVVPVVIAWIRSKVGPNIAQSEKDSVWMGLRPLCVPGGLEQPSILSHVILMFMVLFVYSAMSPLTSFIMVFAFWLMTVAYKNQFIYVYDPSNDTGGKLWAKAVGYVLVSMMIALVTLIGVLGLKKGKVTGPLVIPLLIITILFAMYLSQKHFEVARYLPSQECKRIDKENARTGMGYKFVSAHYTQPALMKKEVHADTSEFIRDDSVKQKDTSLATTPNRDVAGS